MERIACILLRTDRRTMAAGCGRERVRGAGVRPQQPGRNSSRSGGFGIHPSKGEGGSRRRRHACTYAGPPASLAWRYVMLPHATSPSGCASTASGMAPAGGPAGSCPRAAESRCHAANSAALHTADWAAGCTGWAGLALEAPTLSPVVPATASAVPPVSTAGGAAAPAALLPPAAAPACGGRGCCREAGFHLKAGEGGANQTMDAPLPTRLAAEGARPSSCKHCALPLAAGVPRTTGSAAMPLACDALRGRWEDCTAPLGTWICRAGATGRPMPARPSSTSTAVRPTTARCSAAAASSAALLAHDGGGGSSCARATSAEGSGPGDGSPSGAASGSGTGAGPAGGCRLTVMLARCSGSASSALSRDP